MKEDQTKLITARLEHLQFMMNSGNMPIFRQRSDMFLFALEAYNIARGLSSRYYRMQEDLDIRFFVRFQFDPWLQRIQQWIEQLGGVEYRVEDGNFFAEGRAKRLTIVVDRLFGYHLDRLPADSAQGSMALPDEEVLEPFKAIRNMSSVDLVTSFRKALQEVHDNLLRLAMMPVEWTAGKRQEALQLYLSDAQQRAEVQNELADYRYFCAMPGGNTLKSQFCYLKQRLLALTANGALAQLSIAKSDQNELLAKLHTLFGNEETNPSDDQIPSNARPMADDELFAKFLYLVRLDGEHHFPVLDDDKVSNYLIRKDVFLTEEQEKSLQALFALMSAMTAYFDPILTERFSGPRHHARLQQRIDTVMKQIRTYNALLTPLLAHGHQVKELDTFFERLFSPEWRADYGSGQDKLLSLLEKDRDDMKLKPYVQLLREAHNTLLLFLSKPSFGKHLYQCLQDKAIVSDVNEDTVNSYWSKTDYQHDDNWQKAIKLVNAVEKQYKQA